MEKRATEGICRLVDFGISKGLVEREDRRFVINRLLEDMRLDAPAEIEYAPAPAPETATPILEGLLEIAAARGLCRDTADGRDLFSAKLMGEITPPPAFFRAEFERKLASEGVESATTWFYRLCRDCDYIRVDRIRKNERFFEDTSAGRLEITINLSKPEKDPRDIAAQRVVQKTGYPRCMLCPENPGYAGRAGFPARQNHRMLPISLNGEAWYLQFSPYLYYEEHLIALNERHVPMKVSREGFLRMFDFVDQFPHYFIGSNADLPIVGGSILSHDHFQGGRHVFPMDLAPARKELKSPVSGVEAEIADWPLSTIRLKGPSREKLVELADSMLSAWREYSDPACEILAHTDQPHNTITPILRRKHGTYILHLVLRNNRASREHPLGIFHPHADLHHIKKENIGLIEVMGLFILPGRLIRELKELEEYLSGKASLFPQELEKHRSWAESLRARPETAREPRRALRRGLGEKCARVLADAGVYKNTPEGQAGLLRFLEGVGYREI